MKKLIKNKLQSLLYPNHLTWLLSQNLHQLFALASKFVIQKSFSRLIYGDSNSSEFEKIKKLRNKFNSKKNIYLNKFIQNVENLYKISDVVVIPSIVDESFGYVYPEASLFKKPVVASNIGGLKEIIINNYDGYLVDVNNYKYFSKIILMLINNKKLVKLTTIRSYKKVMKKFGAKLMAYNYYKNINK